MLPIIDEPISVAELAGLLGSTHALQDLVASSSIVVVEFDASDASVLHHLSVGSMPIVVAGVSDEPVPLLRPAVFDLVLGSADPMISVAVEAVHRNPLAATALAVLLRGNEHLEVEHALAAESAVYSMLQAGPEFAAWRSSRQRVAADPDTEPAVLADRTGGLLEIRLNRPHRHNAFSRSMRDGLDELLGLALADSSITEVRVSGNGPSFCSGGDLGEFGSFTDVATAHHTRLVRSPARAMHALANRTSVRLHGACMGAGIELPAFAGHISAHPDVRIALPELSIGLVPGAGGTVSIPRRIGRQRTASLALTGQVIEAERALRWGLVDVVEP